jgi:hypothetical protein
MFLTLIEEEMCQESVECSLLQWPSQVQGDQLLMRLFQYFIIVVAYGSEKWMMGFIAEFFFYDSDMANQ